MKNAIASERSGASVTIPDDQLSGELLIDTVRELFADTEKLRNMAQHSKSLAIRNAAELICAEAEKLLTPDAED